MPPVKRTLLNILTLTSLLLSAATLILWIRSEYRSDSLLRTKWWTSESRAGHYRLFADSNDGLLTLGYFARSYPIDTKDWPFDHTRVPEYRWTTMDAHAATDKWLGFAYDSSTEPALAYPGSPVTAYDVARSLTLPYWSLALAFASLPSLRLLARLRSTKPPHLCPHCHYDLRATPHRCPECGHLIASSDHRF